MIRIFLPLLLFITLAGPEKAFSQYQWKVLPKFHLLNAFSPQRPFLQGSVELVFRERFGLELGYGQRYAYSPMATGKPDSVFLPAYGRNLLAEFHWRKLSIDFKNDNWAIEDFIGLSYRNVYDQRNLEAVYRIEGRHVKARDQCATITQIHAWSLRWGTTISNGRFAIDLFTEMGFRNLSRQLLHSEYFDRDGYSPLGKWATAYLPFDGVKFNFNGGVKVCWRLLALSSL